MRETAGSQAHAIPHAGHFVQLEQPAVVATWVLDFLG